MITILLILWAVIFAWSAASVISSMMTLELFWGTPLVTSFFLPNSLYPAGRIQMFYFHPSNEDIATMMFYTLPLLVLANVLLSFQTHLSKSLLIIAWAASLLVLEELFFIELIKPDLFVAVIVLSAMHLLAFLRVPTILGLCFRFAFRLISQIIFFLVYLIMVPLVLQMTVEVSIGILHMIAANSNLPAFGLLLVIVGSFIKALYYIAMTLYTTGDRCCDAAASYCVYLPAIDLEFIAQLPPQDAADAGFNTCHEPRGEETPVETPPPPLVGSPPRNAIVPQQEPLRDEPHPHQPAISWSDDGRYVSNRLYYNTRLVIFSRLFTGHERKSTKKHVKMFRHVMDELLGLVSGVRFVPDREPARCDWRLISTTADDNYNINWIAQDALESVVQVYKRFKEDHPLRSWSNYSKILHECKLFEQTIDCIFLEMKLKAEFAPTPLWRAVQNTWEEEAFDNAEAIEEAAVEPVREEADAILVEEAVEAAEAAVPPPRQEDLVLEEPIDFGQMDDVGEEEEEEEEVLPQPNVRRRRGKSETEKLNSELGTYWEMGPRRSGRVRRAPEWFTP